MVPLYARMKQLYNYGGKYPHVFLRLGNAINYKEITNVSNRSQEPLIDVNNLKRDLESETDL